MIPPMVVGRRRVVTSLTSAGVWLALERLLEAAAAPSSPRASSRIAASVAQDPRLAGARLIETMPLGRLDRRPTPPVHALLGTGLDARQFTDLSDLSSETPLTPTERFYVRTAAPQTLPDPSAWRMLLAGGGQSERALSIQELRDRAQPMGMHVLECAGNNDPANFGLLSAASWAGVPLAEVLDRLPSSSRSDRIRITGFDDERPSTTSVPGAAWVFTRDELEARNAFLATSMNDAPLTAHHGAPVRLVVPNYYGCSAIKWVTRIEAVSDDVEATTQMREFSARTHQGGMPRLAREYEPPAIDLAATPVRVEAWATSDTRGGARRQYRVVGIRWGGTARRVPLTIRFHHREPFVPVDNCPDAESTTTWTLWSHLWTPPAPGRYQIALRTADRGIRTRRLDVYYYTRDVDVS